jgi:inhibitor of cysteine peptidase
MPEIQLTMSDRGRLIAVKPGDTLVISLDENLTTGYEWELAPISSQIVELIDSRYLQKTRAALGGGGTREIRFRAKAPGQAPIQLQLRRSWEPANAAVDRFDVDVQIAP